MLGFIKPFFKKEVRSRISNVLYYTIDGSVLNVKSTLFTEDVYFGSRLESKFYFY